jgi:hypothetical protein
MAALRSKALVAFILVSLVTVAALEGFGEDGEQREGVRLREDKGSSSGEGSKLNLREGSAKNLKLRSNSADGVKLRGGGSEDARTEEEVEGEAEGAGEEAGTYQGSVTGEGMEGGKLLARAASLLPPLGMASPYLRACIEHLRDAKLPEMCLPSFLSSSIPKIPMPPALFPLLLLAATTLISR